MPATSPQWQEKASDFFQSSGLKLKQAGNSAGSFVGDVAKDAKENVADVAEKVGSAVKSRWHILQQPSTRNVGDVADKVSSAVKSRWDILRQPSTRDAMQERLLSAAATTGMFLRMGLSETKDKVAAGKIKVEEVAKKTAQKSRTLMTDIERWQKGVASTDVFGVPIEVTVQRQETNTVVPNILIKCADFLILSGLNSQYLFKAQGDMKVLQQLVSLYNQDLNAAIPDGVNSVDVATLIKCYIASLPEPLVTFELYNEIRNARSSINEITNILKKLPSVNYMTLELVTALLLRVSQKSVLNKMDGRSLAMEMAPMIMWKKGQRPEQYKQCWNNECTPDSGVRGDCNSNQAGWDMRMRAGDSESTDIDASSSIPLDDELPIDLNAIEFIHCLIEHHNTVFTDANTSVWP